MPETVCGVFRYQYLYKYFGYALIKHTIRKDLLLFEANEPKKEFHAII